MNLLRARSSNVDGGTGAVALGATVIGPIGIDALAIGHLAVGETESKQPGPGDVGLGRRQSTKCTGR